ncbi:hypothetical protein ACFRMN_25405 [Streptomyces sp. NPDC056835]|uniref:hypothetical protein n=1 Tax=Streptomyces sp. NPDC056835 TaxID=3345956 RepID=UPI0036B38D1D
MPAPPGHGGAAAPSSYWMYGRMYGRMYGPMRGPMYARNAGGGTGWTYGGDFDTIAYGYPS